MAARKRAGQAGPRQARVPVNQSLVLLGDVRTAPITMQEAGRSYSPDVAIWAQAENGMVWGTVVGPPGRRAQSLVQALLEPGPPPFGPHQELPGQLVLFDEALARDVRDALGDPRIEIRVSERFEPFEAMFASLVQELERKSRPTVDLPDQTIAALCAACARLWRTKPWQYVYDEPAIEVRPRKEGAPPLYACVLGASAEVFGVALYASLDDYERFRDAGEEALGALAGLPEDASPPGELLAALRRRAVLVSFDPKEEVQAEYREQLVRNGWSRRLAVVPTFGVMGGAQPPGDPSVEEAQRAAVAIDALVTFCERHEDALAAEDFPIADTVAVKLGGQTVEVALAVPAVRAHPGEGLPSVSAVRAHPGDADPGEAAAAPAPPAAVYRFKVALTSDRQVWRRIDVRCDQTLVDLHNAIQRAFGWDDDHLYAFFLSGKAWDSATEYVRPHPEREPGMRSARVRLDRLKLQPRQRILYIFDFGDEWRHEVRLERMDLPPDGATYPRIVEQHGTPPQYPDWEEDEDEDGADGADET